tara:strand:- start:207 stop:1331 length:1125 start_codon:yes stop_codon:yes gene_type:complete
MIKSFNKLYKNFNKKKILIITGKKSFNLSGAKKIFLPIIKNNKVVFFFKKNSFPEIDEFVKLCKLCQKVKPQLIIGIGGGASIDYAKLTGVLYNQTKKLKKILKNSKKIKNLKKIKTLVIPSTAGSGAEETSFATLFIKNKKYSVAHKLIKPNDYVLLPKLINSSPKYIKASSGMDTICQSTESLISINSTKKSALYSLKSLKLAFNNIKMFVGSKSLKKSHNMSLAANYSGKAINIAKTNGPHAVSYYFSTYHGISHGHAVSLTLNSFLHFNYLNIKKSRAKFSLEERYKKLFRLTKSKNIDDLTKYYENLIKNLNLEINFSKLRINLKKELKKIVKETNVERLGNNPVDVSKDNLINIIKNNERKNFKKNKL